ncbi:MAG: hypothetical protein Q9167_001755 [Letrouitia subvulpina]
MHPSPISRVQQDPSRSSPPQNVYPQVHTPVRPGPTFGQSMSSPAAGSVNGRLNFKDSPFFTIIQPLTPILECKVREATRDHVDTKIILRPEIADKLVADPSMRVMVYCAADPISHISKTDIAFPHQIEIKINLDEVKTNLRGLKNKPGSTRPADITDLLRKRANYENTMMVTYALTHKKFHVVVNLVKQHPATELVSKLKFGKMISKEQVIRESKTNPGNQSRKQLLMHPMYSDKYFNDILKSTPRDVDQIAIEPDGKWSRLSERSSTSEGGRFPNGDDDDLIEIKDMPRVAAVKSEAASSTSPFIRTPPLSSREDSISSTAPSSAGPKRSIGHVVDLTTSSDEEEEPQRPPKRQSLNPALPSKPDHVASISMRPRPDLGGLSSLPPKPGPGLPYSHHRLSGPM